MSLSVVAKAIKELDTSEEIKECLIALFNFELKGTGNKNAPFKKEYRTAISKQLESLKKSRSVGEDQQD